jgi:hypothetical protein
MNAARALPDMVNTPSQLGPQVRMESVDTMPGLVSAFVEGKSDGAQLLREFMRHVAKMARPYPDAYFVLGAKNDEAVDDLGNRSFSICASVEKGRFPFSGRTPFGAYVEEQFDGRTIRYHSFYAKLAITRELLRDDYAHNLRRDPVLRWRAELYADIGDVLKAHCTAAEQGRGVPPKWSREGGGLRMLQSPEIVTAKLKTLDTADRERLVLEALSLAGPQTQSRLTHMLEAVLGAPSAAETDPGHSEDHTVDRMGVRTAVAEAWDLLEDADKALVIALSQGASYEALIAAHPALNNKVAVSRAVARVGTQFLEKVIAAVGGEASPDATPRTLLEPIMAMLAELFPSDFR